MNIDNMFRDPRLNHLLQTKVTLDAGMKKVHAEIMRRDVAGLRSKSNFTNDPYGYYSGYPVSDLIQPLSLDEKQLVLMELKKMPLISPPPSSPYVLEGIQTHVPQPSHMDMLCMRMRWSSLQATPFENVYVFVVHAKRIFIHIITKDLKTVTLEADDDAIFPSDHLIAELRTLGG